MIDENFEYKGRTLKVIKEHGCEGCYFYKNGDCHDYARTFVGKCIGLYRTDKTSVIAKEIEEESININ